MSDTQRSVDLKISKRFKYTPIFKTSFIKAKEKPPKKCCTCCQTRAAKLTGYVFLAIIFLFSFTGSVVLWATNTYRSTVGEQMVLRKDGSNIEWWLNSPVKPKARIYIFNYTNVDDFLRTGEKLKVQELGPYTYLETLEKVNVVWNDNGTVTFQEKRTYKFDPELSNGRESDVLQTLNIPLIAGVSTVRKEYYLVRLSLAAILSSMNAKPFVTLTAKDLIWGYDDPLFTMGRTVISLKHHMHFKRFGMLTPKNGTSPWRITMHTGEKDISKLGLVSLYNGEDHVDYWNSEDCNRIDGSEGSRYPPSLVHPESRLHIYNRDLCRRFPLVFKEHSRATDDIPTLRFHPPRDIYSHASENPGNACYCDPKSRVCPPSGVFNISPCQYGSPTFLSFPHFYLGDPQLLETVDGLKPDPEKHDTYVDIHPELAVPLSGKSRFQFNVMIDKADGINVLDSFKNGAILPVVWFEAVLDEFPPEIRSVLFHVTFSARALLLAMLYGLPVLTLVSACMLLKAAKRLLRHGGSALPPLDAATAAVIVLSPTDILEAP